MGFEEQPRILCLDVGRRRIGVAVSDPLGLSAQPLTTVNYKRIEEARRQIAEVVERYDPVEVVVGLPLELSGQEGAAVRTMRKIVAGLDGAWGADVPVVEWDERMSTVAAERMLIEGGVRRARRRQVVDSTAASLILQGYLDHRRQRGVKT